MSEKWDEAWALLRPGERLVIWQDGFSSTVFGLISYPDVYAPFEPLVPFWRGDALTLDALLEVALRYLNQRTR